MNPSFGIWNGFNYLCILKAFQWTAVVLAQAYGGVGSRFKAF
jgi:hypothetical protein